MCLKNSESESSTFVMYAAFKKKKPDPETISWKQPFSYSKTRVINKGRFGFFYLLKIKGSCVFQQ